jgi:lysozyme family protein
MADQAFAACLTIVLGLEGGYVDNPLDPGGATNMGITRRTLATWRKVSPYTALPKSQVQTLTREEASRIYEALFWEPSGAGRMPAGLDLALFDFAVHSGVARAVMTLQSIVGATPDGLVGPRTLSAVKARIALIGAAALIDALCDRRLSFLQRLAGALIFGAGWTRRVAAIRSAAKIRAGVAPASPSNTQPWSMTMGFISGYEAYIVGILMILTGAAQMLGIAIPSFDGHTAGQLLMEGAAIVFLRKGINPNPPNGGA